jgi:hypothetical protein
MSQRQDEAMIKPSLLSCSSALRRSEAERPLGRESLPTIFSYSAGEPDDAAKWPAKTILLPH